MIAYIFKIKYFLPKTTEDMKIDQNRENITVLCTKYKLWVIFCFSQN